MLGFMQQHGFLLALLPQVAALRCAVMWHLCACACRQSIVHIAPLLPGFISKIVIGDTVVAGHAVQTWHSHFFNGIGQD